MPSTARKSNTQTGRTTNGRTTKRAAGQRSTRTGGTASTRTSDSGRTTAAKTRRPTATPAKTAAPGTTTWREVRAAAAAKDPDFEKGVAKHREQTQRQIAAYQLTLREIRRAQSMTQMTIAKALGVNQSQVSRIENEADLYLSTLQNYIEALGGELELVGVFNDELVSIKLSDVVSG
jgi:DNA-binding XRE family transcriptional regulator